MHTFAVPANTGFASFLQGIKELVSIIQGTEKVFKPSDLMIVKFVRCNVVSANSSRP